MLEAGILLQTRMLFYVQVQSRNSLTIGFRFRMHGLPTLSAGRGYHGLPATGLGAGQLRVGPRTKSAEASQPWRWRVSVRLSVVRLSGIVARIAPAVHRRVFATAQRRDGHAHIPGEHGIVQKRLGLTQERLRLGLEDELPLSVQGVWERRRDGSQPLGICFEARFGLPLLALGGWDEATELLS